ncbi:glycine oxidase ThiO [Nitrosomonas nitrosa]|uniref:glycine oxidase ThiO n=1 Tax=Nitrosomonas nitrosa TaxID=52442 RepID=UPI000D314DE7|nr:glycine oxidase ThiO [Nitrosomonas nitrosa]MCO6434985.1 glycine oxidase ThiO [Nitrosomonas nitrosa]
MNKAASDFIVIGAGIIGLATAAELLEAGATVTVLERGEIGRESSWAGGGILSPLCPWDYPDEVTLLTDFSAALYPEWVVRLHASTGIDVEYEVSGLLVLPPYDMAAVQTWQHSHNVPVERKRLGDVCFFSQERDFAYPVENALFLPHIAQVRNPRLLSALRSHVAHLGGRLVEHCEVSKFAVSNQMIHGVISTCGRFGADYVIVTAGAWSGQILGEFALSLDIKPIQGQMLLYKFESPPLTSILLQGSVYLIPRRDGHLLVGSTVEDVGFNKQTTSAARDDLFEQARKLLPQLEGMPLIQHWAGLRPASPQNIPIIGPHPLLKNLFINSGHFRYGVTMAPGSAQLLLNAIMGKPQPFDIRPYQKGWEND